MDRAAARAGRRRFSRGCHRVSPRDGGAREIREAVSGMRDFGPENCLRRERDELLPALSDRRSAAGGSLAVAAAPGGLAEDDRGAGGVTSHSNWPCGNLATPAPPV